MPHTYLQCHPCLAEKHVTFNWCALAWLREHREGKSYIAETGILPGNTEVLETPAVSAVDEAVALEAVIHEAGPGQDDDFLQFPRTSITACKP